MSRYKLTIEEKTTRNHTVVIETDKSIDAICDFIEKNNNGIIEAADAYVEHEKAQLFKEGTTSDLISRQAAIDVIEAGRLTKLIDAESAVNGLKNLPTAQPEPTDIDAKEAVYNLAEKIGIHQLFALTVELRGEPIQPELTYEQVEEYCKKRCLHVVTADFFESTKPQRLGHWIKHIDPLDGEQYECSECGVLWEFNDGTPEDNEAYFCPKCGAKMKGEQNERFD